MSAPSLDLDVGIWARLCAALDGNTAAIRQAEARKQQMAQAVSYVNVRPGQFAGSALAVGGEAAGIGRPMHGYNWAVQRLVVAGLGTSDYLTAYRGHTVSDVQGQNALYTFTVSVSGAVATWHPGRTGLVLLGREKMGIVWGGSSSSGAITVSADVIQVTDEQLPYFLL